MADYSAFYFVDVDTAATHLFAWDGHAETWRVPCGLIRRPQRDDVTYAPTKKMCGLCVRLTKPSVTPRLDRPRTRNR